MSIKLIRHFLLVALVTFVAIISLQMTAKAEEINGVLNLDFKNNRIDIHAVNADFKALLSELENKTGIKVNIIGDVHGNPVTLNISSLPLYAVDTLLSKMSLKNYSVVYDGSSSAIAIYVLPEGKDISPYIKGKTVVKQASFSNGKDIEKIKNKEIILTQKGRNNIPIRHVKDEVLLKFHMGVTDVEIEEILRKHNLIKIDDNGISKIGYIKVKIPDDRDVISVIKEIRKEYKLKIPEPNYIASILTSTDPLYSSQWYIPETKFNMAWEVLESETAIKVAVIDSGVDSEHLDLKGKILEGYNFIDGNTDVSDSNGHGTFVAGIIAAAHNDIGIKGLYDYAHIIPIKVIDENGIGTYEDAAKGIVYAADNGAEVINLSIGGYAYSYTLQDAIDYALEKGCIVVAAGGNDGIEQEIYPAAYPDVIGVSALSTGGQIWSYSNSGKHIDVSAPGDNIISTGLDGYYVYASGTSASAAMVSALAAMLIAEKSELSSSMAATLIQQTTNDLGLAGKDQIYGTGEINSVNALKEEIEPFHDVAIRNIEIEPLVVEKGKDIFIVVGVRNQGTFASETVNVKVSVNEEEFLMKKEIYLIDKIGLVFPWNFTETDNQIVKITAKIDPILGEKNVDNNEKTKTLEYSQLDSNLFVLHKIDPGVHQWIAGEAFWEWPNDTSHEIYTYIGSPTDGITYNDFDGNSRYTSNNYSESKKIIYGSKAEDTSDNPFNDWFPYLRHFWNRGAEKLWSSGGLYGTYDSAVDRAYKYWTGGYNLDGEYDGYWDDGDGKKGEGVLYCYQHDQKALAYEYLGHIVHLLTDMSVPAHVLDDQHATNDDNFEEYMAMYNWSVSNNFVYKRYGDNGNSDVTGTIPNYTGYTGTGTDSGLYNIFYDMAELSDNFESDNYDGGTDEALVNNIDHKNGHADGDDGDITWTEASNHQAVLEPYVIRQVAALYKWFWNETHPPDTTAPTITITLPTSSSTYSTSSSSLSIGGTASDNVGVTQVTWANSQGGSGTCSGTTSWSQSGITLYSGLNVITVTAKDSVGNTGTDTLTVTYTPPDTTAPTITINSPTSSSTYSTTSSSINISGTASDNVGVTQVTWANSQGGSGTCSGTTSWSQSGITLSSGQNVITVTGKDAAGYTGTDTLTVTYTPPDTTAPTITINSPTSSSTYSTTSSSINISGTASDNVGVTQVTWANSQGGSGTCSGTTSWNQSGITLSSGQNVITVTAKDAAGYTGTDTLTVTYTINDVDKDGMTDDWENSYFGNTSRDGTGDYDIDGLTDLQEYQAGTNPKMKDTDSDGLPDDWEVYYELNPLIDNSEDDHDSDGQTDLQEYLAGTDPTTPNEPSNLIWMNQYFPLEVDNYWSYSGAASVEFEVDSLANVGDVQTKKVYRSDQEGYIFFTQDEEGTRRFKEEVPDLNMYGIFEPPLKEIPANAFVGNTYSYTSTEKVYTDGTLDGEGQVKFTTNVVGFEDINLPSSAYINGKSYSNFPNCLKLSHNISLNDENIFSETAWYAKDLGVVKTSVSAGTVFITNAITYYDGGLSGTWQGRILNSSGVEVGDLDLSLTQTGSKLTGDVVLDMDSGTTYYLPIQGGYASGPNAVVSASDDSNNANFALTHNGNNLTGPFSSNISNLDYGTIAHPIDTVSTPTFSPSSGTYTSSQSVSISCSTSGAIIRYTTNGTEPTENSNAYSSSITVSSTTTIKAKAYKTGWTASSTATGIYTISGSSSSGGDGGGGGGGGGGIFGEISIDDVIGYHLDGITEDGARIYMPVTNGFKALKGAQTYIERFVPVLANLIRGGFESLERIAEANKDGILYWLGTHVFPVLGKIAEFYLDVVDSQELMTNAYSDTMIGVPEFNKLHRQGIAISPHIVKDADRSKNRNYNLEEMGNGGHFNN